MAAESNFQLDIVTKRNPNGTLDIEPMHVNTNNPNLYRYPVAAGTPVAGPPSMEIHKRTQSPEPII
jgi:hypothetical protein